MSAPDRAAFLRRPGRKCGAYEMEEGTALKRTLRDCAHAFRHGARPFSRPLFAGFLLLLASLSGGCATTGRKETAACPAPPPKSETADASKDGKSFTVGIVIEERPLWKRILWPW